MLEWVPKPALSILKSVLILFVALTSAGERSSSESLLPSKITVALERLGKNQVGGDLPWFAAEIVDGSVLNRKKVLARLKANKQKGVVLVFFATWCAPCKIGIMELVNHSQRLDSAGVTLLLVDYNEDGAGAEAFLEKLGASKYSVLPDRYGEIGKLFGVVNPESGGGLPKTFVAGSDGKILAIFSIEGYDYVERIIHALP
jgi:peroxiredoxin